MREHAPHVLPLVMARLAEYLIRRLGDADQAGTVHGVERQRAARRIDRQRTAGGEPPAFVRLEPLLALAQPQALVRKQFLIRRRVRYLRNLERRTRILDS